MFLAALGVGAAAAAQPVAIAGDGAMPRPGIILFWASWCVPCRAELARLPALAQAARPLPVVTLALDPPDVARETLRRFGMGTHAAFADARPPALVMAEWGGEGTALPLAVAVDQHGTVCGRKRGLLGTDQIRQWIGQCSR